MPVIHIVLVKFAPGLTPADIESWKSLAIDGLAKLPMVKKFELGTKLPNVHDKDYDTGVLVTFDSAEDLAAYIPHPVHEAYRKATKPFMADALIFDMEV